MKKTYLPIYIAFAVVICGFIIGSFFDYQINDALFHDRDTFGLVVSTIGTTPGYGVMAFLGGGCLFLGLKNKVPHKAVRIVMYFLGAVAYGLSIYFSGKEFFGPNGFDYLGIQEFWGFFIVFPVQTGIAFLGYKMTSTTENDKLWLIYIVMLLAILISLVAGVTLIKAIFHRPRFRTLSTTPGIDFYNWWEPCKNYKELMATYNIISEEFKSFPSGHAGTCSVGIMATLFLPYINKKYMKASLIAFCLGAAWLLLVAFSRMYVGAHFLSDVSMGSLLGVLCFFIAMMVIDNVKYFGVKEEPQQE